MPFLKLNEIMITGRTLAEYEAFFDLDLHKLQNKRVLDCPSGVSSFVAEAKEQNIKTIGGDLIYSFSKEEIKKQAQKTIEDIYRDVSWMSENSFEFYKSVDNHKKHRTLALEKFLSDSNKSYKEANLLNLPFEDNSFDLALSSHLLFLYDDRFGLEFHLKAISELIRVSKEVRIFPLVDFKNSRVDEKQNLSPLVYEVVEKLKDKFDIEIKKVNFEFLKRGNQMMVIKS